MWCCRSSDLGLSGAENTRAEMGTGQVWRRKSYFQRPPADPVDHQSMLGGSSLRYKLMRTKTLETSTASRASTEPERSLVVAYWSQRLRVTITSKHWAVNKELKHLGHGVSNITRALDDLKGRKPQLVIQTQKSGKSKQARKLYKVTGAGKQEVAKWLAGEGRE